MHYYNYGHKIVYKSSTLFSSGYFLGGAVRWFTDFAGFLNGAAKHPEEVCPCESMSVRGRFIAPSG